MSAAVVLRKAPGAQSIFSLIIVALGVGAGFPLLTALAPQHVTRAYSIVFRRYTGR